jgi:3-oxoadipate enol-lactonase
VPEAGAVEHDPARGPIVPPGLPPGFLASLPGRGEVFFRHHRHPDPGAPTLVLLHGWTASADLQFFTAYEALTQAYSVVAIDHRGHGRGLRDVATPFRLEDCADDVAGVLDALGVASVVAVGYSMGGAIAMLLARRHPDLVAGLVLEATALEWRDSRRDRMRWRGLALLGTVLRAWWYPRSVDAVLRRMSRLEPSLEPLIPWIEGEVYRNDPRALIQAGRALAVYDARPWALSIALPTGVLLTTRDRLVRPAKQRALAKAMRAEVAELAGDHLSPMLEPAEFSRLTRQLVDSVARRTSRVGSASAPSDALRRVAG